LSERHKAISPDFPERQSPPDNSGQDVHLDNWRHTSVDHLGRNYLLGSAFLENLAKSPCAARRGGCARGGGVSQRPLSGGGIASLPEISVGPSQTCQGRVGFWKLR